MLLLGYLGLGGSRVGGLGRGMTCSLYVVSRDVSTGRSRVAPFGEYYLLIAANSEHVLELLLPDVENRIADLRRTLWIAARSIWRWGFTSEDW